MATVGVFTDPTSAFDSDPAALYLDHEEAMAGMDQYEVSLAV